MDTYLMRIQIKGEELDQVMRDLEEAASKIQVCYLKLMNLGLLTFEEKKEETANGN